MKILKQDKSEFIEIASYDGLAIEEDWNIFEIWLWKKEKYYVLGKYRTKEKAEKVLEEILMADMQKQEKYVMP